MEIILTQENANFDAVASMLGVYKLDMEAIPILSKNQLSNVREFLALYKDDLPFVAWDDFKDGALVEKVILTDTAQRADIRNLKKNTATLIFEHHALKRELADNETFIGDDVGAVTTLLVERIKERKIALSSLEATLMALGIYSDTGNFTYAGTTARDIQAVAWLLEQGAVLETIQNFLNKSSAVRIAHIMSFGQVQTVEADEKIIEIIARIRRIGHEGFPVLDNDKVIGLLTMGNADKALEHGLNQARVRDVMEDGHIVLHPDDSVTLLEETMVKSKWGQIPIQDGSGKIIGIVTRTDLIKHWAQIHPSSIVELPRIELDSIEKTLGKHNLGLIEQISAFAQERKIYMYMVGGVARDLLLERPNFDIDFVIEGDAIDFVTALQFEFGGHIHPYPPFRTATWRLDEESAKKLGLSLEMIPEHLDFATARSELYEHPTALPTVYNSGIKLDLRRRDFTINTLAIQLSPERHQWQILDFYGGLADLNAKLVRVLHSLSFVDDPTRILRAIRFSERLEFTIEERSTELIQTALPMLKRITGERIQNEISLILQEDNPARAILKLDAIGVLKHIHPDFQIIANLKPVFKQVKAGDYPQWITDSLLLRWHLLMAHVPYDSIEAIAGQLLMPDNKVSLLRETALLVQKPGMLMDDSVKPSEIVKHLDKLSEESLFSAWLCLDNSIAEHRIEAYYNTWRHIKPNIDGNTLKALGLKPGPEFRVILASLRSAWIDGLIYNEEQESALLNNIIDEVYDGRTG